MPGYKGHLIGGLGCYGILVLVLSLSLYPISYHVLWLTLCCAGSLFPDIDTKSKGQSLLYPVIAFCLVILWFQAAWDHFATLSLLAMLPLCCRHRGLFHNVWFIAIVTMLIVMRFLWIWPQAFDIISIAGLCFFLGAISHLYLDLGIKKMVKWRF